jgi:hypothetical protein
LSFSSTLLPPAVNSIIRKIERTLGVIFLYHFNPKSQAEYIALKFFPVAAITFRF